MNQGLGIIVHHIMMDDSEMSLSQIANAISICRKRVDNILHNELSIMKVFTWCVPRILTPY